MTFKQFRDSFYKKILPNKPKFIREGQALMNYLGEVWSKEYRKISSLDYYDRDDIDCFYNDKLITNTLKHLESVWEKQYPN